MGHVRTLIFSSLRLLLFLTISLSATTGCRRGETSEYKEFTVSEGPASFSFEYPAFFLKPTVERSSETGYPFVSSVGANDQPGIEFLFIDVFQSSNASPNSTAMLDRDLREHWTKLADFRLLERYPTSVSGYPGEVIAFAYSGLTVVSELTPVNGVSYKAYFDNSGFIWKVGVTADEPGGTPAETHFKHILETFRFLD